jgi:hypothetical protein
MLLQAASVQPCVPLKTGAGAAQPVSPQFFSPRTKRTGRLLSGWMQFTINSEFLEFRASETHAQSLLAGRGRDLHMKEQ